MNYEVSLHVLKLTHFVTHILLCAEVAEVAAQWRAKREAPRGEERAQFHELVTTVIQVPGEAKARVVARDIPETLSVMMDRAGKDNNHLQKKVNVHESAFTWIHRYKTSNSKSE